MSTPAERSFKIIVRMLTEYGHYPSPATINRERGRPNPDYGLNGRECVWRREELVRLGWTEIPLFDRPSGARAFKPPEHWIEHDAPK